MILKTSFFNKGIYKSTLKRFAWGSVLYFIALFLSTTLSILLSTDIFYLHTPKGYFLENPLVLRSNYFIIPMLFAIVVPTVVAVMVFRFIHSKNQAIFSHSLPVSRRANYISSLLAGLTLMCVPIVLNGLSLILVSLCGYGEYFTPFHCVLWMFYNIYIIFIMFSCAAFASNLTGNGFAAVIINIIIHVFLFVLAASLDSMAQKFIYGYTGMNPLFEKIANNNFAYFAFNLSESYFREKLEIWKFFEFALAALVLYFASYFLYKKRKLETAGDVAGFKCLNSVFKYFVTFLATTFCFAVFSDYIGERNAVFAIVVIIISMVSYVASEMILKKTFNVLYSWKGYLVFAVLFAGVVVFVSQTSFFGYETRVPDKSEIKEATVYNYYYKHEKPFSSDKGIIDMAIKLHHEFTDGDIPKVEGRSRYNPDVPFTNLHIKYKLENEKIMERKYTVTLDKCTEVMTELYRVDEYKKKNEIIFMDDSKITNAFVEYENKIDNYEELIEEIRKDVLALSYSELYPNNYDGYETLYSIRLQYNTEAEHLSEGEAIVNYNHLSINKRYVNAVKWLDENGYSKYKRAVTTTEYKD